eukprot:CAMPEP_0194339522 /NCGR_PEP_ID=MMETSP0171-20130528/83438_1 /TAXON_ID=218684 /ORGANISM="Corethron pennatum, Strain L29A3" /LENGTH=251 /DNA_ID=CAMNT_0039104117 /DNA_START=39 /DNA_END=791 /DNA_ORIENTATION=-
MEKGGAAEINLPSKNESKDHDFQTPQISEYTEAGEEMDERDGEYFEDAADATDTGTEGAVAEHFQNLKSLADVKGNERPGDTDCCDPSVVKKPAEKKRSLFDLFDEFWYGPGDNAVSFSSDPVATTNTLDARIFESHMFDCLQKCLLGNDPEFYHVGDPTSPARDGCGSGGVQNSNDCESSSEEPAPWLHIFHEFLFGPDPDESISWNQMTFRSPENISPNSAIDNRSAAFSERSWFSLLHEFLGTTYDYG